MDSTLVKSGLEQLRDAEEMAIEGASKVRSGMDEVGIAIHRIVTQKLYLEEVDEQGRVKFPHFEAYLPTLIGRMGISRSLMYDALNCARLAVGPTFHLSYEEFAQIGGVSAVRAWREKYIDTYDQKTGEVLSFKDIEAPEGVPASKMIIEAAWQIAPNEQGGQPLEPKAYRQALTTMLAVSEDDIKPTVRWYEEILKNGGIRLGYSIERGFGPPVVNWLDEGQPEPVVTSELHNKLHILPKVS